VFGSTGVQAVSVSVSGHRIPDFFIVGHAKCGTTALYETLRSHPEIFMPDVKEPMFFARQARPLAASPRFEQTGRRTETLAQYVSLFASAGADQRVGEASTFYVWSPVAPARIARANPSAKIIAIFREPASFLRSLHLQALENRTETETDLRKAIALEPKRREGYSIPQNAHWPRALIYTDRVRYVEQLRRFYDVFPPEQVLVLIYDDFKLGNDATVRRVLRFLDVDDSVPLAVPKANPTVALGSVRTDRALRSLRAGRDPLSLTVRTAVVALTSPRLRREVLYPMRRRLLYRDPPPPDQQLMQELRQRFRGEVLALSEYLDRDLATLWGYTDDD
jgi:hypothetical protein